MLFLNKILFYFHTSNLILLLSLRSISNSPICKNLFFCRFYREKLPHCHAFMEQLIKQTIGKNSIDNYIRNLLAYFVSAHLQQIEPYTFIEPISHQRTLANNLWKILQFLWLALSYTFIECTTGVFDFLGSWAREKFLSLSSLKRTGTLIDEFAIPLRF